MNNLARNHMAAVLAQMLSTPLAQNNPEAFFDDGVFKGVWNPLTDLNTLPQGADTDDIYVVSHNAFYKDTPLFAGQLVRVVAANKPLLVHQSFFPIEFFASLISFYANQAISTALANGGLIKTAIADAIANAGGGNNGGGGNSNNDIELIATGATISEPDEDGFRTATWDGEQVYTVNNGFLLQSVGYEGDVQIIFKMPVISAGQLFVGIAAAGATQFDNIASLGFYSNGPFNVLAAGNSSFAELGTSTTPQPTTNEIITLTIVGNTITVNGNDIGTVGGPSGFSPSGDVQPMIFFASDAPSLKFSVLPL